jgi:multidrug efflux pump subunit AcrB
LSLSIALAASYVVSVTIIPILAPFLLRIGSGRSRFEKAVSRTSDRLVNGIRDFFSSSLETALRHRFLFIAPALLLWWVTSQFVQPFVGRDVQRAMDTGIIKINFEADANTSLGQTNAILTRMEHIIRKQEGVVYMSSTLGSEPSVVSFGSGKNPQQGNITVNLVDRFHRKQNLWAFENNLSREFAKIPDIKSVDVFDYGATAMSSLRAFSM